MTFSAAAPGRYKDAPPDLPVRRSDNTLKIPGSVLRPSAVTDLEHYIHLFADPDVRRFIGIDAGALPGQEELREIVEGAARGWDIRGWGRWSVFDDVTGDFQGFTGFRSENGSPELICMFHKRHWGTNVTRASTLAGLRFGFDSRGFSEIWSYCRPDHVRGRGFVEKIGGDFRGCVEYHGVNGASYVHTPDSLPAHTD